jgi:hypothetical protein
MDFRKFYEWFDPRVEKFPLVELTKNLLERYSRGIGVQLKVDEKADFVRVFEDSEMIAALQAFVWTYGVLLFRFLDEGSFPVPFKGEREADLCHPGFSQPFHVDIDYRRFHPDGYTKWESWTYGAQALFQNPTQQGRVADTLISPVKSVASTMEAQLDPNRSELSPELREYFAESLKRGMSIRSKGTCKKTALIMAWNRHFISQYRVGTEMPQIESVNRVLFDRSPHVVRVPWSDPELSRGGMLVFWDAGFNGEKTRILAHARDNKGIPLPTNKPNLYRF